MHWRRQPRVPLEIEVTLESEHTFYSGLTADISEGGVFVATHMLPPVGEELELMLRLPDEPEPFFLRGTVRWQRDLRVASESAPSGFGFQWRSIDQRALAAIQRIVDQRDTIYYEAA